MDAEDETAGASPTDAPQTPPSADTVAVAPAVTLVMVSHAPGVWFPEVLGAIAALDYPALDVVVVDAASPEPIAPAVGEVLPDARVIRLEENAGFGRAIDAVRADLDLASLVLLAHDDVIPDPGAVRVLVEEAFRSNAAIVGPKLVRFDDPRRLLAAGEGVDKFGYPVPIVERGELDQEQHDAVRDAFTVPSAFTLVRADLLDAIDGFDPACSWFGDDLDMCWRTHVAGGRVLVAPAARVRHLEALGERRMVDDRRRLQFRHRLRVVLASYRRLTLLWVLPQLLVVHLVEVLFSLLTGRPGHARDVVTAWTWNLRRLGSLRQRRASLHAIRTVSDGEVRSLQVRGSARVAAFFRGQLGSGNDPLASAATLSRRLVDAVAGPGRRAALLAWLAVGLVLVLGSRHLLTRPIPAVGELVPFPEQIGPVLSEWAGSWRRAGTGSEGFAASADLLVGVGVAVFLGAAGLLRTVLILGMLPLGLVGVWRLVAPTHSVRASVVGLFAYVAVPIGFDSLATGSWRGLVGYGLTPWVFARLLRASGRAPFGTADPPAGPRVAVPPLWRQTLVLGVLVALAAAVDPLWVVLPVLLVVAMLPGSVLAWDLRGSLRMAATAVGAGAIAVVLHAPWAVELLGPDLTWSTFTGGRTQDPSHVGVLEVLRFDTGPIGSSVLNAAVVIAAAYVLVVGRGWRLTWAARAWSIALCSWGLVWAAGAGRLPFALPPTEFVLAPAGVAMALSAGLGAAAFDFDVRRRDFSWRQFASVVAVGSLAVAFLPTLAASVGGRWLMPRSDHRHALAFLDAEAAADDFRVVWFGDPDVLPLTGWPLLEETAYATTQDGTPVFQDRSPGHPEAHDAPLRNALDLALDLETARLGRIVAPMGVRYLVVVERVVPVPYGGAARPAPAELTTALDQQLDLVRIEVNPAVTVYRNAAWMPTVSVHPAGALPADEVPAMPDGARQAASAELAARATALDRDGVASARGSVVAGSEVMIGSTPIDGWEVSVDGAAASTRTVFGWAPVAATSRDGTASVIWATPLAHRAALAAQIATMAVVALVLYVTRAERRDARRPRQVEPRSTPRAGRRSRRSTDAGRHSRAAEADR